MSDLDDIEFKIARLELGPDDTLVIKCDHLLSDAQHRRIGEVLKKVFGFDRKYLVLERGFELAVCAASVLGVEKPAAA